MVHKYISFGWDEKREVKAEEWKKQKRRSLGKVCTWNLTWWDKHSQKKYKSGNKKGTTPSWLVTFLQISGILATLATVV